MTKEECKKIILEKLDERELMEQLAEECTELAQAALKWIRASGSSKNPTPTNIAEGIRNLYEEEEDVYLMLDLLRDMETMKKINEENPKWQRWVERLKNV